MSNGVQRSVGFTANRVNPGDKPTRMRLTMRHTLLSRGISRRKLAVFLTIIASAGMLALVLVPANESTAHAGNTGGGCDSCHPTTGTTFLTVTGLPASLYVPGNAYTVTISIADTNGATGRNSIDFIVSAGTVTSSDPNVVVASSTEAVASIYTVSAWTLTWTAPTSGQATIDVWGVFGGGSRITSPWNHQTSALNPSAIPEFSTVVVPLVGILGVVLVVTRVSKKHR